MNLTNNQKGKLSTGAIIGIVIGAIVLFIVLTIVVMIILAAIVMNSSSDIVSEANFAGFYQEFGDYSDAVMFGVSNKKVQVANNAQVINNAQAYYMLANGFDYVTEKNGTDMKVPAGFILPEAIQYALYGRENEEVVAYIIDDKNIEGYEDRYLFYGDSNGKEYHLVTSDGYVFTIPGYPTEQEDGSIEYIISSSGKSYIVSKESISEKVVEAPIFAKNFDEIYGVDLNGESVNTSPIYKKGLETK